MKIQLDDYEITTIMTGEPWRENCYLVRHIPSSEQMLIDPGNDVDCIIKNVLNNNKGLKKILITHAHHDHVGAVPVLHKRFGMPCYLHKADARLMRQAYIYAFVFDGRQIEPFVSSYLYEDEETLEIGRQPIHIIRTPGHTSGSSCYYFGNFIFTGDTILYQHVGRTDMPGSDVNQLMSSVTRLVEKLPEDTVIFPGHGRMWTIGEARAWWQDAIASPPQYKKFGLI